MPASNRARIHVCQSGTCRRKGSDATLVEIEELADLVGDCDVGTTGCLGYCRRGPAVEVVSHNLKRRYHVRVTTLEKSAAVVEAATGRAPPLADLQAEKSARLAAARSGERREHLLATHQWNQALAGLAEASVARPRLRPQILSILQKAGYPDADVTDLLPPASVREMPAVIEGYVQWTLTAVEAVSAHSALFRFETSNLKRGTPHPRGRARMADPITWHVTLLGEVGANKEGPLPWIERDYTPVSSALQWERGRCDILIKVYNDGLLTDWLRRRTDPLAPGTRVWLSKPVRTLSVPSLAADDDDGFRPRSVLLLLAGTGVVALPQVLAHRDPLRKLGIGTPTYKRLLCPIDLIQSCREDDVLLLPEIREHCLEGAKPGSRMRGLRSCTLLLTAAQGGAGAPPFQGKWDEGKAPDPAAALAEVPNACVRRCRLDADVVATAIEKMDYPFRVVVSGNDTFNGAAKGFLDELQVPSNYVTMLSA